MALTLVSATVTDSDGQLWVRGSWRVDFVPNPSVPNLASYKVDGASALNPQMLTQYGTMDNNGSFSVSLYDNTSVTPQGSSWKLTVCPLSSAACGFYSFAATGPAIDISSALTYLLPAPRFLGVYPNYGYADLEVILSNHPGSTYYNVLQQVQKYYNDQTQTWFPGGGSMSILNGQQDPNTIQQAGIYYLPDGLIANAPSPGYGVDTRGAVLEVFSFTATPTQAGYILQRLMTANDQAHCNIYIRWYCDISNVMQWTSWHYFAPTGTA